jgi:transposase, IS5 family
MRPRDTRRDDQRNLFRLHLDQIVNPDHALVRLAQTIDWAFLEQHFGSAYEDGVGRPPLPTRLMAGLAILKATFNLSDEVLCERWLENPYYQLFCGEEFFQHQLPFDRSSLTRWRQRMGEEKLTALMQESLAMAVRTKAAKPADFKKVIIDTTVQEKAITFPTDAKLMHRALERLGRLAKRHKLKLRRSYARVAKRALIQYQRYAHAKQFKRANRELKRLRTMLGALIRDITRKLADRPQLSAFFHLALSLARRVKDQRRGERGPKVYSLHAPEVECIGKGKPHKPYEFGVKVSLATTLDRCKGGQFLVHAKALPGNPYDGHTLATVIPDIEAQTGAQLDKIVVDAGYRGHNAPKDKSFKVYVAGMKRGLTKQIKRFFKRRSAVEPCIGHTKIEHRMGRNFLAHSTGDAINAVLAAVGYNFSLLLNWFRLLFVLILAAIATIVAALSPAPPHIALQQA